MKKLLVAAALAVAAFAYAAAGDLLVISKKEVEADAAAGLSYIGSCASGYLYSGSAAALGRVAPYRTLDRDAAAKDYYVVWAPAFVKLDPGAFAHLGFATRLSPDEVLVGVEKGMGGAAAIRAVEYRTELRLLQPVTRVKGWKAAAEPPPTEKDPAIEAAINAITAALYASYIQNLQDFESRSCDSHGLAQSRLYIRDFMAAQQLNATLFEFENPWEPAAPEKALCGGAGLIWVLTKASTIKLTRDAGGTWDSIDIPLGGAPGWQLKGENGRAAGRSRYLNTTRDGGDSWDYLPIAFAGSANSDIWCRAVDFVTSEIGWLAGEYQVTPPTWRGFLVRTTDGGLTWSLAGIPESPLVTKVSSYNGSTAWADCLDGDYKTRIIYLTSNGAYWFNTEFPNTVKDIDATGAAEAWAVNGGGSLYHTVDGVHVTPVDPGTGGTFAAVGFPDNQHGFAAGSKLIATDDGGASWREISIPFGTPITTLSFASPVYGIIGDDRLANLYYTSDGGTHWSEAPTDFEPYSANVVGERKGIEKPDEIVIIGGHFDSTSYNGNSAWAPGAEDNASASACVLTAAAALNGLTFKRTVRYITFDAEETGLAGSEAYARECAARGENIVAVLNADMVSYGEENGGRDDLSVAHKDAGDLWLYNYLKGVGALYGNKLVYDYYMWSGSDHASFWDAGYPALGIIEGEIGVGGGSEYPYCHTTQDTLDKIQPAFGVRVARDLAATVAHLARSEYVGMEDPKPRDIAARPKARAFAVYPNPYRAGASAEGIRFVGLATPATVAVYDITGRKVASWNVGASAGDECCWRPAAAGGAPLAPGVYLYTVEGDNQREAGKLALVK